jgi:hypothetical protein
LLIVRVLEYIDDLDKEVEGRKAIFSFGILKIEKLKDVGLIWC